MLRYNVAELLRSAPGTSERHDITGLRLPLGEGLELARPIEGRVKLTNSGRGILVQGRFASVLAERCSRCLRPAEAPITFEIEEEACRIDFKRPGAYAQVAVDRATGAVTGEATSSGAMAVINDLHMGRDSGGSWSLLIDVTAWLMTFVSISGMALLLALPKRRRLGLAAMAVGLAACIAVYVWLVP